MTVIANNSGEDSIAPRNVLFIKLGEKGEWEADCLENGFLQLDYRQTPHELCLAGEWDKVREFWIPKRGSQRQATRDRDQIRAFYETDESCLFITFANGFLYWCRPTGSVEVMPDMVRRRATVDGWHSHSINGAPLSFDRLSGNLLSVRRFPGTICHVEHHAYVVRKINDEIAPQLAFAEEAETTMIHAITSMLGLLRWQDFELLVDLIFSASGWRRVGGIGGPQKDVDLDLLLPTTGERAFVQVKSVANAEVFRYYAERFARSDLYDRMFFVWHTGTVPDQEDVDGITLIGPERLARMCLDAGLASWLREKVS